ncbi:MAG TPA: alpha/beta fold hydrolase [Polyangiaceae bacterium]|nr:alpha/beta fold hydrolase [Polyangiaceae bacterium]
MKPKLLLLHGFTGSPRSWDAVVTELGERFDVSAPALTGHVEQSGANVDSFAGEVERLRRILDGAAHVTLAGYSLGARLGLGLLLSAPERFASALLVGVNPGLSDESERAERRRADARWSALLRERGLAAFNEAWAAQPLFESQRAVEPDLLEQQRRERMGHDATGLARALELFSLGRMPDFWPRLSELGLPITLAAGELDQKFLDIARRAVVELPLGRLLIAPSAGHNLPLERPDLLARSILEGQRT